jgi:hypothetical protein
LEAYIPEKLLIALDYNTHMRARGSGTCGRLRQENHEFKASLGYKVRLLKKKKPK